MQSRSVLLLDLPSYAVPQASPYRELLERRLKAQTIIYERRLGFPLQRPDLPYSRGLLTIAAYVEQHGHHVRYLVYADPTDAQRFAALCREAEVIGFTAMTPVVQQVYALCTQAKQLNPSALCVLGGPHANALQEHCLDECSGLDVVIAGDGEVPFVRLVDQLSRYQDVPGIIYRRRGDTIVCNPGSGKTQILATVHLPQLAYHLLTRPLHSYAHNVRTAPGCPYTCDFCIERLSWSRRKGRNSLEHIIDELHLLTQGATEQTLIHFSDSIFTLDKARTIALCERIAHARFKAVFSCDTRVDHIDAEIVNALATARFACVRLGIETMDDAILQSNKKGQLAQQSVQALEIIRRLAPEMVIYAYMLTGLPGSTMETISAAAGDLQPLIGQENVDIIGNKMLVPYPGTSYFASPEQYQMQILHHKWSQFDRMSLPVYRLADLTEYQIYFAFLFLESVQVRAYEERIGNPLLVSQAYSESLDYVYRNYVQSTGP